MQENKNAHRLQEGQRYRAKDGPLSPEADSDAEGWVEHEIAIYEIEGDVVSTNIGYMSAKAIWEKALSGEYVLADG